MGRFYYIDTGYQTVTAASDLLEIVAPASCVVVIHSVMIDQTSDVLASEAETLQLNYKRVTGSYSSGSGGNSATITKALNGDATASVTAERNNTTQASAGTGTITTLFTDAFDVLSGYERTWVPELRLIVAPSTGLVISMAAPTDSLTVRALVIVEEIG